MQRRIFMMKGQEHNLNMYDYAFPLFSPIQGPLKKSPFLLNYCYSASTNVYYRDQIGSQRINSTNYQSTQSKVHIPKSFVRIQQSNVRSPKSVVRSPQSIGRSPKTSLLSIVSSYTLSLVLQNLCHEIWTLDCGFGFWISDY